MPEPSDSLVEPGKVNHLSTEGQSHTLTEEDESSINKVLWWVRMVSRHDAKGNERTCNREERNREGPMGHGTKNSKNASHTEAEINATLSSKPRIGLHGLFLRKNSRDETSENVLYKDDLDDVCRPGDKEDNIILGCSAQNPASRVNFITEELEASPYLSMIDDRSDNIAADDIQQRVRLCQDERSQNRLASLMSFWESVNKGPKILSIKKSVTNENKASSRKISKLEFNLSPSKAKTFEYTDMCESYKLFSKSRNGTRHDNVSVIPSVREKTSSFDNVRKPQEHGLEIQSASESLNSPSKQLDDIPIYKLKQLYSPVPSIREAMTEQDTISDNKACWGREKSRPEIIISTPDCKPKHYSEQGLKISTSPNQLESSEPSSSFLSRDLGELKALSKGKLEQSTEGVLVNSPLDGTNKKSYTRSPFRTHMLGSEDGIKFSPVSYPIRNISSVSQDHRDQIPEQSRTLSPRHMPKVLSIGSHAVKKSGMGGSLLRAFPIDINPTEKTSLKSLEHTTRRQTRYPHGLSGVEDSSPWKDEMLLPKRPVQRLLSLPGNTSERNMQNQLTSPHSPPRFERSQASGRSCIGNITSKLTSQIHCLPVSKGQTSAQLITSPEHHRKTIIKRSVDGTEDVIPAVLTEQTQLDDSQCKTSLTRSCIRLSCQQCLNLAESTHVSWFSDQLNKQEWSGVQIGESSNHTSPSRESQCESEITFDSSSSTSAEAWSLSPKSSACER